MSEQRIFAPSGRDFMGVGDKRSLELCSFHIEKIIFSIILYKDPLEIHQCYFGWEVFLGEELQDVKPQV